MATDYRPTRLSERKFYRIEPINLSSNGTSDGIVTIESTYGFKVNQKITLRSDALQPRIYKVSRVESETQFRVSSLEDPIFKYADISDMLVSDNAVVVLPEQKRPSIDPVDIQGMVFEEEPTVALRSHLVDWLGRSYGENNPLAVQLSDGSIDIGTVNAELEVQLSHKDDFPDSGDVRDAVNVVDGFLIRRFEKIDNVEYEGIADQGSLPSEAKWRITRTVKQPNGDLVTSIVGDTSYDQVWDDRDSLFSPVAPTDFFDRKWEKILPILNNANFLKLGNFDSVVPSFAGDIATLNYFEGGANIARITIRYVHELDWDMGIETFINDSNGDILLDDDGSSLILE